MKKYLVLVVLGILLLLASRLSAEPRFSSDVVGNFMVNDTLTVNGDGVFNFGAAEKVYLDGTTISHTDTAGLLDINVTTATASVTSIDVSTTLTADVDNVHGIKSTFTSTAAGTTEKVGGSFKADLQGHAGDNDDRIHSALVMTGSKNFGNSNLDALVVQGAEWDNILTAESGNVTFSGYNAVILAEAAVVGNGPELRIQAGNGDDNGGANPQNGGNMYVYGGAKDNAGTDGDTVLAYNSASAVGNVGIRTSTVTDPLTVAGDTMITNAGGSSNSYKLKLAARWATGPETQTSSLFTAFGADPYFVIAAPNATGVETNVIHMDPGSFRMASDDTTDIGKTGANRPKDIFLSGNLDAEGGSISANTTLSAGTTVTAGTGITSTTGNVTASAGSMVDQYANVRLVRPTVEAADPGEPFDCVDAVRGHHILVDDTDDGTGDVECVCLRVDDVGGHEWQRADDNATICPSLP